MPSAVELIDQGLQVGDKIIPRPTNEIKIEFSPNDILFHFKYEVLISGKPLTVIDLTL